MKDKSIIWVFIVFSQFAFSQIQGIVKDSLSGKPIPYVNIWVENENIGTTTEENGEFNISVSQKRKNLIVSVIGYQKKIIKISQSKNIFLSPSDFQIQEVIISNRKNTKEIEIGKTNSLISQAFESGPKIDLKYFPYFPSYKKTKYIKKIVINTDNRLEEALIRMHLYSVGKDSLPEKELLTKDLIISVKSGTRNNKINLTSFDLKMPTEGVFVGFEKLMIEKNKFEKKIKDANSNLVKTQITYCPYILYNTVESQYKYTFSGGKWMKSAAKITIDEPAINLILTN